VIEVESLSVRFGTGRHAVDAVRDVSFRVPQGGAFGLVGESGSGKSTVLRTLAGLVPAAAGTVRIGGEALGLRRTLAQRKAVQMVFQDPYGSLHPRHTVDHILAEPCAIHGLSDADGRVRRSLTEVGLSPRHRFRQRQRVAIARALILEPEVVLLDEPTSALDVSVQAEVLNLLADLRRAHGLTYLFVSHNLAVVAQTCERLAVMTQGRIVEEADSAALAEDALQHPYSRQLLESSRGYDRARAAALATLG
jgi:ABC-type dipeptide/oligopeptide/nickel transport system ATPase subunit